MYIYQKTKNMLHKTKSRSKSGCQLDFEKKKVVLKGSIFKKKGF